MRLNRSLTRGLGSVVLAALLGLFVLGCGGNSSTVPTTYSVTGTVKYPTGRPVASGGIQFLPLGDKSFSVSGEIKADGTFTLYTVKGNERVAGAPEGEYQATVQPPIPASHRPVPAVVLPKTYRVEPRDNTFTIEIPPEGKKP